MYSLLKFTSLLAVALLASCGGKEQSGDAESEALQKSNVRVEEVQLVAVNQISTFTATIEADQVNNIAPAMGGRIRRINVDVGAYVRR
ncbi:MAG: efflux transporter periplasmic adaptor subunit, partial [Proteiniphilum sp.]|nr:efflux transporter periplasmic adaptor subunit [Proteiniphilum sp.]